CHGEFPKFRVDRNTFQEMGRYGLFLFLGGLAYQWMINGPPTVLAAHVNSAELVFFTIPQMIFQRLIVLLSSASMGFFPFASAAVASDSRMALASMFRSNLSMTLLTI